MLLLALALALALSLFWCYTAHGSSKSCSVLPASALCCFYATVCTVCTCCYIFPRRSFAHSRHLFSLRTVLSLFALSHSPFLLPSPMHIFIVFHTHMLAAFAMCRVHTHIHSYSYSIPISLFGRVIFLIAVLS